MDNSRLPDYFTLIKQQFALQEELLGYHSKIESLIELILAKDLFNYSKSKLNDCLLCICDLSQQARKLNVTGMDTLIKITALLIDPQVPPSHSKH